VCVRGDVGATRRGGQIIMKTSGACKLLQVSHTARGTIHDCALRCCVKNVILFILLVPSAPTTLLHRLHDGNGGKRNHHHTDPTPH